MIRTIVFCAAVLVPMIACGQLTFSPLNQELVVDENGLLVYRPIGPALDLSMYRVPGSPLIESVETESMLDKLTRELLGSGPQLLQLTPHSALDLSMYRESGSTLIESVETESILEKLSRERLGNDPQLLQLTPHSTSVSPIALPPVESTTPTFKTTVVEQTNVFAAAERAIVEIGVMHDGTFHFAGTGFFVGNDKTIATAAHVYSPFAQLVADKSAVFSARKSDSSGHRFVVTISIRAVSEDNDAALFSVNPNLIKQQWPEFSIEPLSVAEEKLSIGDPVAFIGFTQILPGRPIAAKGIVAGKDDGWTYYIDTSVFIGHSGSPVFSTQSGRVVGIEFGTQEQRHLLNDDSAKPFSFAMLTRFTSSSSLVQLLNTP